MALIRAILDSINKLFSFIFLAAVIFVFSFLAGCSFQSKSVPPDESNLANDSIASKSQSIGQYVKIYTGDTAEDHFTFYYDLYNKAGTLIKHDCTYMDEPDASMPLNDVIKISVQTGTGLSTRWTYYYDLSSNRVSRIFYYVLSEKENKVAYFDGEQIVVSDIFDEEKYTKKITLNQELSKSTDPIESVSFSNDLSKISITYFSGTDNQVINEVVWL